MIVQLTITTDLHHLQTEKLGVIRQGYPNDDFLLNTLKTLFRLSRVVLDLKKYILSGGIKIGFCSVILGDLSLFDITRASELFSRKF